MQKHVQIKNSYKNWLSFTMKRKIQTALDGQSFTYTTAITIEWWAHNIGYWLTKPLSFIPAIKHINLRCKDVDLMVEVEEGV